MSPTSRSRRLARWLAADTAVPRWIVAFLCFSAVVDFVGDHL
ncbi:hypothetical protein AB0903_33550 [Streptomyces sp. NPDC048389]